MTKRITVVFNFGAGLIPGGPVTTNGNTRDIPELINCTKLTYFVTVTASSGTSQTLNVDVQFRDPATSQATGQYVNVQTKIMGINANGVQTTGGLSLGTFDQVTNATSLPWTEMRCVTADMGFGGIPRIAYRVGGTSPSFTFSVTVVGESEE